MIKDFKSAFTLSELLIALGVIGVLSAVLLPIIFNLAPNQNTIMARRAFSIAQAAVSDLINDEFCYPDLTRSSTDPKVGFDDGAGHAKCQKWGTSATESTANKFAVLFADKIGSSTTAANKTFKTKDGIEWEIVGGDDGVNYIKVDVNGNSKAPNCSTTTTACSSDWDKFQIKVNANGKMEIGNAWARNAIKVDNDFIGNGSGDDADSAGDSDFVSN